MTLFVREEKAQDLLLPQERDLKTGHVFDGPLGSQPQQHQERKLHLFHTKMSLACPLISTN